MSNAAYFADLSDNNPSFDASAYVRAGHRLLGLKVSQGAAEEDPLWRARATAVRNSNLSVLLYHFADSTADAETQAAHFVKCIRQWGRYDDRRDHVFVDEEQMSNLTDPVGFRKEFEAKVHSSGFRACGLYSDCGYLEQYGEGLKPTAGGLWVAGYPDLTEGWWTEIWWAHQYSQTGTVAGVAGPCDLSVLR